MSLETVWFIVVAVFWTGFFVLEGFDFGVGVLHTVVGRTDDERRVAINSIGPFWDGNEVWLIVAGAAMFAAFPAWYATMFSGPLPRAAARAGGADRARGRVRVPRQARRRRAGSAAWTWATTLGSASIPLVLGIGLGDLVAGLPIDADGEYAGSFTDIFTPYGVWVGVTLLSLCAAARRGVPGAQDRRARAAARACAGRQARARRRGRDARVRRLVADACSSALAPVAVLAAAGAAARRPRGLGLHRHGGRDGRRPSARCSSTCSRTCMVSSTDAAYNLTVAGAASGSYALKVMTVAAGRAGPARAALPGLELPRVPRPGGPPSRSHDSA